LRSRVKFQAVIYPYSFDNLRVLHDSQLRPSCTGNTEPSLAEMVCNSM